MCVCVCVCERERERECVCVLFPADVCFPGRPHLSLPSPDFLINHNGPSLACYILVDRWAISLCMLNNTTHTHRHTHTDTHTHTHTHNTQHPTTLTATQSDI